MARFLGIDAGGSSTRAVLVDGDETIWSNSGPPANLSQTGTGPIEPILNGILLDCPLPDAICGGFAGLVAKSQEPEVLAVLARIFPNVPAVCVADYAIALEACGSGTTVCVICGTGSLVCSRDRTGAIRKSGGRGFILGDEGSGFQLGREALLHFLDSGRDDVSKGLADAVMANFGTINTEELIRKVYEPGFSPKGISSLAEVLATDASKSSIYALKALRIHFGKLAHVVSIHLRQYHDELRKVSIGCQGGIWKSQVFRDAFEEQLRFWCMVDSLDVDFEPRLPVYGAVEIAKRLIL